MKNKMWFALLVGAVLLLSSVPAVADSISPTSVVANLNIGESMTVHKTVTVSAGSPTAAKADIFFLADSTGSMGDVIAGVQTAALNILSTTAGYGDIAWGVGTYRDVGDAYVYKLNQDITPNQTLVQNGIISWSAGGGGDTPEADLFALERVANSTSWRAGASKILVWMGDAPGHDPSVGITEAMATAALTGKSIKTMAANISHFGQSLDDLGQATRITNATGGTLFNGVDAANIAAKILEAIAKGFANYTNVSLAVDGAHPNVAVSIAPSGYTGTFDRSIERNFNFDVTFTCTGEGTDSFAINALVDGGIIAREIDRITNGAIPEPGSILLFGTVILGIATGLRRRQRTA